MACEITYNNFKISLVVFMPNITTNHAITYTNFQNVVCVFTILVKFDIYFLGLSWELIVFGVITDN